MTVEILGPDWAVGSQEPLDARVKVMEQAGWEDLVLDSREGFAGDLRSFGLTTASIAEALRTFDDATVDLRRAEKVLEPYRGVSFAQDPPEYLKAKNVYYGARRSAVQRLSDWWNGRVTVVTEVTERIARIPLFVLGTPASPGCRATWTNEIVAGLSGGWTVGIAGTGLGSDRATSYVTSSGFEAVSGQTKLIFLDVPIRLQQLEIRQVGLAPQQGWRVNLGDLEGKEFSPGLLLLDADRVPPRGPLLTTIPLAGDPTGATATVKKEYVQKSSASASLGLKINGADLGLKAKSDLSSTVSISYDLRTGLDYHLYYAQDCEGLLF